MKNLFLFILILLTSISFAQDEWAPTGAVWHYDYNNQTVSGYVKIESTGDTIIDGKTCKILNKTRYCNNGFSSDIDTLDLGKEYTYLDSNIVYYYRFDQFYVLYDFNATISDGWIVSGNNDFTSICDTTGYVFVDSTTIMNINNNDLKGLFVNFPDSSNWYMYGLVLEKLGCLSYMFPEPYMCVLDAYEGGGLRCYSDSIFGFYQRDTTPCDYIYMANSNVKEKENKDIRIFPNPFKNYINIEFSKASELKGYEINLYSSLGLRIRKIRPTSSLTVVNLSDISNGCYYLEIENPKNQKIVRKLIKNAP